MKLFGDVVHIEGATNVTTTSSQVNAIVVDGNGNMSQQVFPYNPQTQEANVGNAGGGDNASIYFTLFMAGFMWWEDTGSAIMGLIGMAIPTSISIIPTGITNGITIGTTPGTRNGTTTITNTKTTPTSPIKTKKVGLTIQGKSPHTITLMNIPTLTIMIRYMTIHTHKIVLLPKTDLIHKTTLICKTDHILKAVPITNLAQRYS